MKKINKVGYTIVELLIVLAVTSVVAISAFGMVQGQRERNEFTQAVRDFETRLTDIANDVYQGYYPQLSTNNPLCTVPAFGLTFAAAGGAIQGGSANCIFAGKAVEFSPETGDTRMRVLTLATRRIARNGLPVTSMTDLSNNDIAPVESSSISTPASFVLDESFPLLFGLRVRSINGNTSITPSTIAFISGFSRRAASGSSYTGSPETNIFSITNTQSGQAGTDLRTRLRTVGNYQPAGTTGIQICLEQGVNGRRALVTVGNEQRKMTVNSVLASTDNLGDQPC